MTKLCPRGKSAAKRKFKVYPSAYANAYASKICAGKIKDPSGTKRKDFKGPKPAGKAMGGRISRAGGGVAEAAAKLRAQGLMGGGMAMPRAMYGSGDKVEKKVTKPGMKMVRGSGKDRFKPTQAVKKEDLPKLMQEMRNNYKGGGPVCKLATKGKGRAYGKNS